MAGCQPAQCDELSLHYIYRLAGKIKPLIKPPQTANNKHNTRLRGHAATTAPTATAAPLLPVLWLEGGEQPLMAKKMPDPCPVGRYPAVEGGLQCTTLLRPNAAI
jgi:hypothetical protein